MEVLARTLIDTADAERGTVGIERSKVIQNPVVIVETVVAHVQGLEVEHPIQHILVLDKV
jgi:hypothetical protein